jgi:hypothetical protein
MILYQDIETLLFVFDLPRTLSGPNFFKDDLMPNLMKLLNHHCYYGWLLRGNNAGYKSYTVKKG